ncbi:helix-turn-helix domain-containing protein [Arsenicibacter rosenii]|uniref:helix-turn-helix domain-containing protein n=1 Tax=Arsenicibacter rosenii TaxID=1750698 RepID=UPI001E4332D4|nr:AraC family transcriptional regulator [Arsenicibacter rosenii]
MMPSQPLHFDVFALIILLGMVQGVLLGIFFLTGSRRFDAGNRCLGWMMLAVASMTTEIFLNYTNYMFRMLTLVDFSEPANFLPGPLFFLFVYTRTHLTLPKRWWLHFVPAGIWLLNAVTWLYQPTVFKYNSYLNSHHPELPFVEPCPHYLPEDFTGLRPYVTELTLLSLVIYVIWSFIIIGQTFRKLGGRFFSSQPAYLARIRNLTIGISLLPILIVVVKPNYHHDVGDYMLACYITITIYLTTIMVMSGSSFFRPEALPVPAGENALPGEPKKKYGKSALSEEVEDTLLNRLTQLLTTEQPYLDSDLTLPKLAQRLNTSPHHLSQVLNNRLQQSFFDMLAQYRVQEAQRLLQDPANGHLKIDEIAERVG